jgi:hypothetical protein
MIEILTAAANLHNTALLKLTAIPSKSVQKFEHLSLVAPATFSGNEMFLKPF